MNKTFLHKMATCLDPVANVERILEHRAIFIAVIVLLTLVLGAFIPKLSFTTSIHDLIIEDLPENKQYQTLLL